MLLLAALAVAPVVRAALPPGFVDITLAGNITNSSALAVAPDGRVFFGQQNGIVRIIKNGVLLPAPFVTVSANSSNERGLLGIAFDPGFSSNHFVYLHYTTNAVSPNVVQRISRFAANGDVAAPGETILIETDPVAADEELGGGLVFGPDGMLYIGIGDAEIGVNAQATNSLFGKVLRIRSDGTIPADNPFFAQNTGKNRAVWALGFRNPFAMDFDASGRLFANDVGSGAAAAREEINHVVAGANYGWPTCEGSCANPAFSNPVHFTLHTNNFNAITGGAFYNPPSPLFPSFYSGKYFFADLATSTIELLDPATTNVIPFASGLPGSLVSLQVGSDGALYYLVRGATGPANGAGLVGKIVSGVTSLLSLGSSWKYLDTGTNLPSGWASPAFNDSSWSNGVAQIGWGNNGEVTLVRSNRSDGSRIVTTYFRKAFVLNNSAPFSNYVVDLVRDDGGVVYVNGTEVFRSNMPTGTITASTLATLSVGGFDERAVFGGLIDPSVFVSGTNVLAVEIHQNAINTGTDMSFDAALFGINGNASLRAFLSGGEIVISYPSWANRFTLESAPAIPTNTWSVVTNAASPLGDQLRVNVPIGSSHRFFRLRSP